MVLLDMRFHRSSVVDPELCIPDPDSTSQVLPDPPKTRYSKKGICVSVRTKNEIRMCMINEDLDHLGCTV